MEPVSTTILLDAAGIAETLDEMAGAIYNHLPDGVPLAIIGIRNRGEVLAARLVEELYKLGISDIDIGNLDITLYRDDLADLGPQAIVRKTEINFDINGQYIILIDDVLHTGRTVRASMDALVDIGRPKAIRLAVLVERPGRELPIQADFVGVSVPKEETPVTVQLTESDGIDEVRVG
ncbi:MAG: bifunctional pyr operon transcriptional regulator/uracil phosphoribosyltransferase PyrR [Planctomycetota bacterium]|jgi:pyrimidine operon attenuation protein/uracil phosphoribosyltransferase